MNIGILAHALESLIETHEYLETVDELTKIANHATKGVSNPAEQEKFVEIKNSFLEELKSYTDINLFDYEVDILEMANLRYLLPSEIIATIITIIKENEATLAVIGKDIKDLQTRVEKAITACQNLISSLKEVNIDAYEIEPGDAAIAVQFPISLYRNDLKALGKEFVKTESILSELIKYSTGETTPFSIEALSNEAATVIVGIALAAADRISLILERVSKAFLNVQEGRLKAQELRERKAGSEAIIDRRKKLADEQEKLSNDELLEELKLIAAELNKSQIENARIGFEKALKKLIEQKIAGVEYDVLAIPFEVETDAEDIESQEKENKIIKRINSRDTREMVRLAKNIDPKLIEHLGTTAEDKDEEK